MHAELDDIIADGSPASDHRTQTDAYSAWDEWLVDCSVLVSSKRPVLKGNCAELLPFSGLEVRALCWKRVTARNYGPYMFGEGLFMPCC